MGQRNSRAARTRIRPPQHQAQERQDRRCNGKNRERMQPRDSCVKLHNGQPDQCPQNKAQVCGWRDRGADKLRTTSPATPQYLPCQEAEDPRAQYDEIAVSHDYWNTNLPYSGPDDSEHVLRESGQKTRKRWQRDRNQ